MKAGRGKKSDEGRVIGRAIGRGGKGRLKRVIES